MHTIHCVPHSALTQWICRPVQVRAWYDTLAPSPAVTNHADIRFNWLRQDQRLIGVFVRVTSKSWPRNSPVTFREELKPGQDTQSCEGVCFLVNKCIDRGRCSFGLWSINTWIPACACVCMCVCVCVCVCACAYVDTQKRSYCKGHSLYILFHSNIITK